MPWIIRSDALHEWFRCLARVVPMPCIPVWKSLPWGVDGVRTSRRWRSFDSQCKVTTSAGGICYFLGALVRFEEKNSHTDLTDFLMAHRNHGNHRKCLRHRLRIVFKSRRVFCCPAEIKEITESAFGTGCALYLSPAEMKEIKESAFGTGCALIMYRSHRNKGNHRKCLWHRLRTESEAKNFFYFFYFCGT